MQWDEDNFSLFRRECNDVAANFPSLSVKKEEQRICFIGNLPFSAKYKDQLISDEYYVKIVTQVNHPILAPDVYELGGRIPKEADFHVYESGKLCLETDIEVNRIFSRNPTIIGFIEKLLIPFLYRHSYIQKFKNTPYPDRKHGLVGYIDYYKECFGVDDAIVAIELLRLCQKNHYRGHTLCPCGSSKKLRNCHGPLISNLGENGRSTILQHDATIIVQSYDEYMKLKKAYRGKYAQ